MSTTQKLSMYTPDNRTYFTLSFNVESRKTRVITMLSVKNEEYDTIYRMLVGLEGTVIRKKDTAKVARKSGLAIRNLLFDLKVHSVFNLDHVRDFLATAFAYNSHFNDQIQELTIKFKYNISNKAKIAKIISKMEQDSLISDLKLKY